MFPTQAFNIEEDGSFSKEENGHAMVEHINN